MNLISETKEEFTVQCNLCKKEIIIKKQDCSKIEYGYKINHEIECSSCKSRDSVIMDYNKMLKKYNSKEKHKNELAFKQAKKDYYYEQKQKEINTIRCINCNSNNIKKIGSVSKAKSAFLWGIFSIGKVSKTYECKSCGYRW